MADHPPPKSTAPEREVLTTALQYLRDSLVRSCDGLSEEEVLRSPVASGTSLLWIVRHAAFAEAVWVLDRFAGVDRVPDGTDVLVPDASGGPEPAASVALFRATSARVDRVVAAASLDDRLTATATDAVVNLRWILVHLVEELARHAGHADIIRELIDGTTGR
jgi:uncharacterized damage-inducible protein DinB